MLVKGNRCMEGRRNATEDKLFVAWNRCMEGRRNTSQKPDRSQLGCYKSRMTSCLTDDIVIVVAGMRKGFTDSSKDTSTDTSWETSRETWTDILKGCSRTAEFAMSSYEMSRWSSSQRCSLC
eukprot:TRINITY_DN3251_c0_g1_i1.p2 TRINITY_DN3251_c0_g1~~TRINITY_DN3251_c0_g1_i1.p2  ORF type:complete len:122 (+),score=15.37 TRINITY_DN3251_c0_g1_i1:252-617(+)